MRSVTVNLYKYNELSPESKSVAFDNEIEYRLEEQEWDQYSTNMRKAVDEADAKRATDFVETLVEKYCRTEIETFLQTLEFTGDGEIFHAEFVK